MGIGVVIGMGEGVVRGVVLGGGKGMREVYKGQFSSPTLTSLSLYVFYC